MQERRKQWRFLLNDQSQWYWLVVHPDRSEHRSERTFSTLKDCLDDASHNGYVMWRPEGERRDELKLSPLLREVLRRDS
jgi:hypothetical protein